jgi:hypothetical protein
MRGTVSPLTYTSLCCLKPKDRVRHFKCDCLVVHRLRWEKNIKMGVRDIGCNYVKWIELHKFVNREVNFLISCMRRIL